MVKSNRSTGLVVFLGIPLPRMLIAYYSKLKVVLPMPFQTGLNTLCVPIMLPYSWL